MCSAMKPALEFINYTDASEQTHKHNRRKVASYIGTHYRNRSRPSAKRELAPSNGCSSTQPQQSARSKSGDVQIGSRQIPWRVGPRVVSPLTVHDMHGFRSDPFDSYPIAVTEMVSKAIEYCGSAVPTMLNPISLTAV